jgi:hypothetical protein
MCILRVVSVDLHTVHQPPATSRSRFFKQGFTSPRRQSHNLRGHMPCKVETTPHYLTLFTRITTHVAKVGHFQFQSEKADADTVGSTQNLFVLKPSHNLRYPISSSTAEVY